MIPEDKAAEVLDWLVLLTGVPIDAVENPFRHSR
jgi:hypothetical protein